MLHSQRERAANISRVRGMIYKALENGVEVDYEKLVYEAMRVIYVTEKKAKEYIKIILLEGKAVLKDGIITAAGVKK